MSGVLRKLVAGVALLAMLVGVPVLLVAMAGWPLPTKLPDWSNATRMIEQGNIEATTVVKTLACFVWAAWIFVAWAVVWEVIVNVPRMFNGRGHAKPAPLAPASVSKGVGWLIAVLLATSAVSQTAAAAPSLGSLTEGSDTARSELSVDASSSYDDAAPGSVSSSGSMFDEYAATGDRDVWVSAADDTLWSISQASGATIDEILTLNSSLDPVAAIAPGSAIVLPDGADVPADRQAQPVAVLTEASTETGDSASAATYVVQDNDGWRNVAEALLGDEERHVEMQQLAVGQEVAPGVVFTQDMAVIHPGWVFMATPDASDIAGPVVEGDVVEVETVHVVEEGEWLSTIAEDHLGDADRWTEVWELNANEVMDASGNVFDDPDLILPGWELDLPGSTSVDDAVASGEPAVVESPEIAEPVGDVSEESPVEVVDVTDAGDVADVQVDETEAADDGAVEESAEAEASFPPPAGIPVAPVSNESSAGASMSGSGASISAEASVDADAVAAAWQRSVWAQIAAGSLLLAGLTVAVRRWRLRRLARLEAGHRIVGPPAVAAGTELAVSRLPESMEEMSTLRGLMQTLTPYAAEQNDPPSVRAVQMSSEKIEVLFASPAPFPPKGWSSVDGQHSWTHRFNGDPVASNQLLTPALVTIGRRVDEDGDEVLLDLETAATVAIDGDPDAAMGLARSMALELATYPLGVPIELALIGLHVDGTEVCDRVWQDTTLQRAVRVTREYLDAFSVDGTTSIVAARAELEADDGRHDPRIFMVNADTVSDGDRPLLDELIDICQPALGIAVVVVGGHANANEQINLNADSTLTWSGVSMSAPNVTLEAASEAAVMLDHAANAESEPMEPSEMMTAWLQETDHDNEADDHLHIVDADVLADSDVDTAADERSDGFDSVGHRRVVDDEVPVFEYTEPDHDIVLQVMGSVIAKPIDLTTNETELLGFLACVRGQSQIDLELIHEALAPDRERKTVENRLSKLRQRLGVGSDEVDLLPAVSSGGRGVHPYYELSKLVITDVDLLEHRLHTAHELTSTDALRVLRGGLDLMEGPFFRTRAGFNWVHSEGVVASMTSVVTNYARMLIELAVEVDDVALVYRTTAAAGRVLDNPVAEFPFRQIEEQYAEACGDEDLLASVDTARQRLRKYLRDDDALATP